MKKEKWQEQWPDLNFQYLIISTDDYCVGIDHACDIDWQTTKEFDDIGHKDGQSFNSILNEISLLEATPKHHLNNVEKISYKRMLGEGVARALEGDYLSAWNACIYASQYLKDRSLEQSRKWYLSSAILGFLIFAILGLILWIYRDYYVFIFGISGFSVCLSFCFGCVGAFFSISTRLGRTNVNAQAEKILHYMEAMSRVLSGGAAGILVAMFIDSGLFVPFLKDMDNSLMIMCSLAYVSGASERLAPSLISSVKPIGGGESEEKNSNSI